MTGSPGQIWIDDALVPVHDARIDALDRGFIVGDGVFETLKVRDGVPFALSRHLERLARSASGLGLPEPDAERIRSAVGRTLAANGATSGVSRLRITWTAGAGVLGSERHELRPTLVVAIGAATDWPATDAVVLVPWRRNEHSAVAGLKTTSYAENVVALARAHDMGAGEAIFANTAGELCEGTGSNIFVVVDGRLLTPSLSSGALAGITRALVLEWCDAHEAVLPMSVLAEADEVMLTSSTRDVQPVHAVDGRELDAPGPITRSVMREFSERSAADVDP